MSLHPHRYPRRLVVTHARAQAAFQEARARDVENGGVYDTRSAAIIIWSEPWSSPAQERVSDTVGTICLSWRTPDDAHATVTCLEVEAGWALAEVRHHLALLFGPPELTP